MPLRINIVKPTLTTSLVKTNLHVKAVTETIYERKLRINVVKPTISTLPIKTSTEVKTMKLIVEPITETISGRKLTINIVKPTIVKLFIRPTMKSVINRELVLDKIEQIEQSTSESKPTGGRCIHGKTQNGYYCRECPGKGICEHNRRRSNCKQCGGASICEHNVIRSRCKQCGGGSICEHNKRRTLCTECGGGGLCEHKVQRSQCKKCDGGSICEHEKIRIRCVECGGSQICEHGRRRSECRECEGGSICKHGVRRSGCSKCRNELPIEEVLRRYKNACVICGKSLNTLKRKLEKLCLEHSKEYNKRPEHYWREILGRELRFHPSSIDEYVYTDPRCKDEKFRPDETYITEKVVFILELDEKSHKSYIIECELRRTVNMKDAFPNHKLLMIRMNPDTCKSCPKELKDMVDRTLYMIETLKFYLIEENQKELDDRMTNVIYMFYGQKGRQHIEASKQNPDKVNIIDTIYCD